MYAVTGVTGLTGACVARSLASQGMPFRELARDPSRAPGLGEVVQVDLGRPETLPPALEAVEAAYLVTSAAADTVELQTNFARAAAQAGVKHIVKVSVPWAGSFEGVRLCRMHGEVEQAIREAGLGLTALRPFAFMQNSFGDIPSIREGRLYNPLPPEARIWMTDARDIAECAAAALADRPEGAFDLMGHSMTQPEAAAVLGRHLGRTVEHVPITAQQAMEGMLAAGFPQWLAEDFGNFVGRDAAQHPPQSGDIRRLTGRAPRTYDDFVRDHIEVFEAPVEA